MTQAIAADAAAAAEQLQGFDLSGSVVIVTGASGLLGTHILSALGVMAELGLGPEKLIAISKSNLPRFVSPVATSTTSLRIDLVKEFDKSKLPTADYIIHAAGYGQPNKFMSDPRTTIELNTRSTMNLIDLLANSGRFLFASSSEVYSGLSNPPFVEGQIGTTSPQHARAPYIEGKRCGEAICHSILSSSSRYVATRIALAYGPGVFQNDDRVLYSFIRQAVERGRIEVADSGFARRTYCYVGDTVAILMKLLLRADIAGVFNIGGISHTSIRDLAFLVAEITNAEVAFHESKQMTAGAPADVSLDLTKTLNAVGLPRFVSLRDGVDRTVRWWKEAI